MGMLEWLGLRGSNARDAPAVTDSVRDSGQVFTFGRADSGERVDEKSAMQIATVYACVRLLAETVAGLPLHLYRYTDDTEKGKERAKDHPLYKLLYRQPNPDMTSFSFRETLMTHLLLYGNAYAQVIRDGKNTILSMYPLLPENVEVDRDEKGQIYYIYHAYTDEVPGENNKDIYFRRDEIFHIPGLGFNGLVGFSPIAMMKNSLGTTLAVEKYGSAFFKNGAQPSGVLEHPGVLKNPEKIRENWSDVYGGPNNAHKVAVLEEGMQYKAISLPPEDSQFLSTRQFGVNEICRIFRVPPHMVQDLEHATFSNIEHQSIDFVVHLPELKTLIDAVESARFIPKEKSAALVKKIGSLTSLHNTAKLVRNVDVENRIKSDNEKIYYIMEALNNAINEKRKVSFQYFTYNVRKEQKLRHSGEVYLFSPYKLIWNGDYYYAVGYSDKHNGVGSFRIDRIVSTPQLLSEPTHEPPKGFDMNRYLNSMFRMYNGERKEIELICDNDLMDAIIDKFGKDVTVLANDMKSFRAVVNTAVGPVFYSWVFGFGGGVIIKSPEDVKKEFADLVFATAERVRKPN